MPRDWSGVFLIALALLSFDLGIIGFHLYLGPGSDWPEVVYQSLQLFFLNFETVDGAEMNLWLQAARYGAFVTAVWAILKAFFPQIRQNIRRWLRLRGNACAVILGYGPVGQAIGAALWQRDCGIRRVTAVHPSVTPDLSARARMDGVLLIEGDPSDPRVLDRIYVGRAERIYVSDPDDLRAIDTAVAVRKHLPGTQRDIRVVLNDSAVAAQIAEATVAGFLGAPNLRWFSVPDETARLLIADARFDRFALESRAERMHLAIIGCGSQGEAIAVEALLTAWRIGLGPPKITFLDRDPAAVEARMRRRLPAWFVQPEGGALYPAARPDLEFLTCDAETLDIARDPCIDGLRVRVSGWVFATGDDALNLRGSLALHRAIATRQIDPAPIFVRIPTGHVEESSDLSANLLRLTHTFGSLDSVVARSPLLAQDPDKVPKTLHAEYAKAAVEMGLATTVEDWASLPETKRDANRALFRHSVMKIEDFGAVATMGDDGVPVTDPGLSDKLRRVDESLAYHRIDRGNFAVDWLKKAEAVDQADLETAVLIRDAAICEHNRWTMERALAQFMPTEHPDRALRDDVRRLHNNMHDWFELGDAATRRYDLVMLRALLSERAAAPQRMHSRARVRTVFLAVDGAEKTCRAHVSGSGAALGADACELHVHVNAQNDPASHADFLSAVVKCLDPHVDARKQLLPTRIRFDFTRPPDEQSLTLAIRMALELRRKLPETVRIDSFWNWRAVGGPIVGVVGHRDLTAFGGIDPVTEALRQTFMDLVACKGAEQMIVGYAPGADRAAVEAWASLGLAKPMLVFPFAGWDVEGRRVYFTEEAEVATADTRITEVEASRFGLPLLPAKSEGHRAQADELLERAEVMVFVVDESKQVVDGGSGDTLNRARQMKREVLIIAPSGCR